MTAKEALKWHRLNHQSFIDAMWDGTDNNPFDEAFLMAINALEKQVPKKPVDFEDKMWGCPCCNNHLMWKWDKYPTKLQNKRNGLPYCLDCGQAIDWTVIDLLESGE